MMTREQALRQLAGMVVSRIHPHPLRVAIDGIDAACKTTLADELVNEKNQTRGFNSSYGITLHIPMM